MAKAVPIHKLTQPDALLIDSVAVIRVRLGELMEFAPAILDAANVTELHDMRIAAKRLRYTLEVFAPALPADSVKPILSLVSELQEKIGVIHDCDVLLPLLEATLAHEEERERKKALKKKPELPPYFAAEGLLPLISRKRAEREDRYVQFVTWWQALPPDFFWDSVSGLIPNAPATTDETLS